MAVERSELMIPGPVGQIQLLIDHPATAPRGVVLVSHPQPLLGGSPRHVVPLTLARHLCADGWIVVRPGFRGVGKSEGVHAEGIGEAEDAGVVLEHCRRQYPGVPLALVGFSFGAHVYARLACALQDPPQAVVLLGLPVGEVPGGRYYEPLPLPADCLLVHGEHDEMAPLENLLAWARPDQRALVLYPGADHFFRGCLAQVAGQVTDYLRSRSAGDQ